MDIMLEEAVMNSPRGTVLLHAGPVATCSKAFQELQEICNRVINELGKAWRVRGGLRKPQMRSLYLHDTSQTASYTLE